MTSFSLPQHLLPGGRYDAWRPRPPAYVVADVDGTLVGPSRHATREVAAAVADGEARGLRIGFATGRMRLAVVELWEQLRASGPHILHNGAEVRADGRTVAAWPMSRDQLAAVFRVVHGAAAYAEIYLPDGYLVTERLEAARPHWEMLGAEPLGTVGSVDDVDGEVLKVTFAVFDGAAGPLVDALRDAGLSAGPAGSPLTPDILYVNATSPDVDKGRALAVAAAHVGVELDHVVAIGDNDNDLPMLAVAGTAIAMGNAPDHVKRSAHLIVPDVDAHGVAHAIEACLGWRSH